MNPLRWMLAMYVVLFTKVLAHELGHAVAALRLTADPVLVLTGRPLMVARLGAHSSSSWRSWA